MTTPVVDPAWSAARNGMPGDLTAVDQATQVDQFLATHGIAAVYQGAMQVAPASPGATTGAVFSWLAPGDAGWLGACDVDQPFTMPAGVTAIDRVEVACLPVDAGAGLQVTLYPDSGSGLPNLAAPIVSAVIPAAHITATSAPLGLAGGGPLATAWSNTLYAGPATQVAWAKPASSINGSANYGTAVTSGNWTLIIGGYDFIAHVPVAGVSAVQYLGSGQVSGATPQPSLPVAAWNSMACATVDTVVVAGGSTPGGSLDSVWTASWDPSTGTLGTWSAQTPIPGTLTNAAMAGYGTSVYLVAGSTTGLAANISPNVWIASAVNNQITGWTAGPPLPAACQFPFIAALNGWLIVAGGLDAGGNYLSDTWIAQINADGSLGGWQTGPPLPLPAAVFSVGMTTAVTDSALVLVSGDTLSGGTANQMLTVTADGPATRWQWQNWASVPGTHCAAYPDGQAGGWQLVSYGSASYTTSVLTPAPFVSVPLPASGLTPGDTYHLLFRQSQS